MDRRPPAASVAWVERVVGPGARVIATRRLSGGITSMVHRLRVADAGGALHDLILKRFVDSDPGDGWAELHREAAALRAIERTVLPVPRLVGLSGPAEGDGHPALLMTMARGRVDLSPRDPRRWLGALAAGLAQIHALTVDAPRSPTWRIGRTPWVPPGSKRPDVWARAAGVLAEPAPPGSVLIHGDYQHFNLLWTRGHLTGIVDWAAAGLGHPDRDVGHCRLNLAVLYSVAWAEEFTTAYEAEAGRRVDRWWDVHEICVYGDDWPRFIPIQVAHRTPVDIAGMSDRVEQLLARTLD